MSGGRIAYLSRIKAISAVAVVILHTFYSAYSKALPDGQRAALMSVRNLTTWAVPCFVMVTGALLLDPKRELTYKKLFGKMILRMCITLLAFTLIFSCFDALLIKKDFSGGTFAEALKTTVFGGGWPHIWYLYLMIALYLTMPAYKLITKAASKRDILYLCVVYAVFLSVIPTANTLLGSDKNIAFYICTSSVYPLYLFLGYAMHQGFIKPGLIPSMLMALIGAGSTVGLTVYSTTHETKFASLLNNYSFVLTAITAIGVYGLLMCSKDRSPALIDKVAAELESCSFGIYLLHLIPLKVIFAAAKFKPMEHGGYITLLGIAAGVTVLSYAATKLLKLIPGVKKII